jgi:hypothetical protein
MTPPPSTPELDELTITIVVDNATDTLSSIAPGIPQLPEIVYLLSGVAPTGHYDGHNCVVVSTISASPVTVSPHSPQHDRATPAARWATRPNVHPERRGAAGDHRAISASPARSDQRPSQRSSRSVRWRSKSTVASATLSELGLANPRTARPGRRSGASGIEAGLRRRRSATNAIRAFGATSALAWRITQEGRVHRRRPSGSGLGRVRPVPQSPSVPRSPNRW